MTVDKQDVLSALRKVMEQGVALLVARPDAEGITPLRVPMNDKAAAAFRVQCAEALQQVESSSPVPYTAEAELAEGQFFLIHAAEDLAELSALQTLAVDIAGREIISPAELDTRLLMYAFALGDEDPVVFVRRTDPRLTHRKGQFLALGKERLALVDGPVFSFAPGFDFILTRDWVVVLSQTPFERVFRDSGLVRKNVSTWVKGITDHLPMPSEHVQALEQVALRDSRTWRRLRDIQRRGHLVNVRLADVSAYASRMGLDADTIVKDGHLVFEEQQRFSFLQLLSEDLYRGELTHQVFEAHRKEKV